MTLSLKRIIGLFAVAFVLMISCSKPSDSDKKIRQSNFVYEDNVNGRIPPPNNVIESTNFFYNDNGTLSGANVYDDTSATAILLKKINIIYDRDKVTVDTYIDTIGNALYYVGFNDKKQVTSITLPDSSGLYLSYFNDRISRIQVLPTRIEYVNFIYDSNDNLMQYETQNNDSIVFRSTFEYNNDLIGSEFDSRFLIRGIKFVYLGGVNLMQKLGLNLGETSKNKLVARTDIYTHGGNIFEHYDYEYTGNSKGDIVKRNIKFSTDTLYYQFKY